VAEVHPDVGRDDELGKEEGTLPRVDLQRIRSIETV